MNTASILTADVLDIIFDARNKEYGAYDLRKHYHSRLMKSLTITFMLAGLICLTYVLLGSMKPAEDKLMVGPDLNIIAVEPPPKEKIEVIPPPKLLPPPAVKTLIYSTFRMIKEDVPEYEKPPTVDELETAKIGSVKNEGTDDIDLIGPPVDDRKGIVDMPKKQDQGGNGFEPVEIESQYPGGISAWGAFLNRHLSYPQDAVDIGLQGTVIVQFIVDAAGSVSNVDAISGPEELRPAAVAVIKKSGKWTPALQNGRHIKSYKKQPITFRLEEGQ